jgi:hypothetical protein
VEAVFMVAVVIEPVVAELVNYRSDGCIRAVAAEVVAAELAVWG